MCALPWHPSMRPLRPPQRRIVRLGAGMSLELHNTPCPGCPCLQFFKGCKSLNLDLVLTSAAALENAF